MAHEAIALPPGYRLTRYETLDSTNSEALRRAGEGEAHGLWVWALSQSAGRGRLDRTWESLPGNLFASLLLRPRCATAATPQLAFVAGLGLYHAVSRFADSQANLDFSLKWPNDLLCAGMKVGGVLLESTNDASGALAVVMGVGLNLSAHPKGTNYPATDLSAHGVDAAPARALELLAHSFDSWLHLWRNGDGFDAIRSAWQERALPLGARIEIRLTGKSLEGMYNGIDENGALLLAQPDGTQTTITTGDVFPL